MLGKQQCIESMAHEIGIIRHLARKVPAGKLDWRPTPGQRSVRELLQYLTVCALIPAAYVREGNWSSADRLGKESERLDPKDFDAAMEREAAELAKIVGSYSDAEMAERPASMPWGTPCRTGEGLVNMCLKTLVAYRMQLFLYAKQAGAADLASHDCWVGVDAPKK